MSSDPSGFPTFSLSRDEVRELDRRAIHEYGVPGVVLMENAGRGAAELLMRLNPDRKLVVIMCGPGNNGGDGFVIARHLEIKGYPVSVWLFAPGDDAPPGYRSYPQLSEDNETNYAVWNVDHQFPRINTRELPKYQGWQDKLVAELSTPCWVADAMFGTGLARPLDAPYAELADILNAAGNPILAVDVPSGLDCDTGEPLGPTIRADHTATFVAPKKGFANSNSWAWTGQVYVVDIGAPRKLVDEFRRRGESRSA